WYDGWLARKFNYITDWGRFLDPLADKILISSAFFAFYYIEVLELWMVVVIVIRDFLITGLRAYAEYKKYFFKTNYLAKWKTFLQMLFIYYLLCLFTLRTIIWESITFNNILDYLTNSYLIYYAMFTVTIFTLFTGLVYLYQNRFLIAQLISIEIKQS
ncbi:CDP-alcohol phosphatidyltransferase family protein, partial [Bacteroidota bacterium]